MANNSKLLDIAEDIKKLSTSGNVIQVDEYKNGKKVEKQRQQGRAGKTKKKKLPIYVITNGSTNGYKIILTKPKKKKQYPVIGIDY